MKYKVKKFALAGQIGTACEPTDEEKEEVIARDFNAPYTPDLESDEFVWIRFENGHLASLPKSNLEALV